MRSAEVARVFGELRRWLPGLIRDVVARQANETVIASRSAPLRWMRKRRWAVTMMALLGFNFDAGRFDVSTHPFCGGVPGGRADDHALPRG